VFDIPVDESASEKEKMAKTIKATYDKLGIYCLVVHPVKSASCCIGGEVFYVDGPYCEKPVLTTGAGDNFNAGFCLGQSLGLTPMSSLTLGVSTSGFYVRNGKSPAYDDVIGFAKQWSEGKI
jgi:sugar/nucleoside kinase (ribokinase family)